MVATPFGQRRPYGSAVFSSEILDKPIETDAALLELAGTRHAKLADGWQIGKHEETLVRTQARRCVAPHSKRSSTRTSHPARTPPRQTSAQFVFVIGISCVHPPIRHAG